MAQLSLQNVSPAGLNPTYASAAAGGDKFTNASDERTIAHIKNGGGASITVTVTAQKTSAVVPGFGTLPVANQTYTIAAGAERFIGPFSDAFTDDTGNVSIGYSAVTSVTVAALRIGRTA